MTTGESVLLSNRYADWYWALIRKAQAEGRKKTRPYQYDRHHIIPECFGGGRGSNLVLLTRREHYVAHLLLIRMTVGVPRAKMVYAFFRFGPKDSGGLPYLAYTRWCSAFKRALTGFSVLALAPRDLLLQISEASGAISQESKELGEQYRGKLRALSVANITAYNEAVARGERQLTQRQLDARRRNGTKVGTANGLLSEEAQRTRTSRRKETTLKRYTPEQLSEWSRRKRVNPEAIRMTLKAKHAAGLLPVTEKQLAARKTSPSEEQRKKQSARMSTLIWVHQSHQGGTLRKRVPPEDFNSYQERGWSRGQGVLPCQASDPPLAD